MKSVLYSIALCISCLCLTFSSCKKTDDNSVNPNNNSGISSNTPGANWKVSLFTEPDENKTHNYSGYTFDFNSDGGVSANRNGQTTPGTWRQYSDDGVTKFQITLNTTDRDLTELNDDWVVVSKSNTFISLKDDNAASNEQLQFSK